MSREPRDAQLSDRWDLLEAIPERTAMQTRSATKRARPPDDHIQQRLRRAMTGPNEAPTPAQGADARDGEEPAALKQTATVPAAGFPAWTGKR
jgi:hypothetical protein